MLENTPWYRRPDPPLLVGHLMASAPPRNRAENAGSGAISLLLHAALLTLAVYLTSGPIAGAHVAPPPRDIFLPASPIDEPPPPPPVAGPQSAVATNADLPPGFKVLPTPPSTPMDIPPIRAGLPMSEVDYGGIGAENGSAAAARGPGRAGAPPDVTSAPVFVPVTIAPELRNRAEVARALERAYPPTLREAGMTGRVLVWILIDERGEVMKALVKESSGLAPLDQAALGVARLMRFTPGMNRDVRVKVWVAIPVEFTLRAK